MSKEIWRFINLGIQQLIVGFVARWCQLARKDLILSSSGSRADRRVSFSAKFFRKSRAIQRFNNQLVLSQLGGASWQVQFHASLSRDLEQIKKCCLRQTSSVCRYLKFLALDGFVSVQIIKPFVFLQVPNRPVHFEAFFFDSP